MRERQMLEALQQVTDWIGRPQLAKLLGRKRLTQGDFEALAALEARGLIEIQRKPDLRPGGYVALYKSKGQ